MASRLRPGTTPADIYQMAMEEIPERYLYAFMGCGKRRVPFVGHGVGLSVDEYPVIASGFDEPLRYGMTIALEPKIGIAGVGMVGSENTYLVQAGGGESITGHSQGLIEVGF